jgi:hypothetical protein
MAEEFCFGTDELVDVKKDWAQKREIQKKKASVNESLFE